MHLVKVTFLKLKCRASLYLVRNVSLLCHKDWKFHEEGLKRNNSELKELKNNKRIISTSVAIDGEHHLLVSLLYPFRTLELNVSREDSIQHLTSFTEYKENTETYAQSFVIFFERRRANIKVVGVEQEKNGISEELK